MSLNALRLKLILTLSEFPKRRGGIIISYSVLDEIN